MFKTNVLTVISILLTWASLAQSQTYIGGEVAVTHDVYEIIDQGDRIKSVGSMSGLFGFTVRQELKTRFFVETGVVRKYYNEGISFKNINGRIGGTGVAVWYLPLRFGRRNSLIKDKLFLVPLAGYVFCINSDYVSDHSGSGGSGGSGYIGMAGADQVRYEYSSISKRRNFSLVQTGLNLELNMKKAGILILSTNYYVGFNKVTAQYVTYTINSDPAQTANAYSKGENLSIGLAFKYPVSNFWQKN